MTQLKFKIRHNNIDDFEKEFRKAILLGLYFDQELLPSLDEVREQTKLSKYALQNCFDGLVNEGVLTKRRAESYRVHRPTTLNHVFESLASVQNNIDAAGLKASVEVLSTTVMDFDSSIHKGFNIDTKVLKIEKRYRANDTVVLFQTCYYPLDLCKDLEKKDIENLPIYQILSSEYGVKIKGANKHLDAITLNLIQQSLLMSDELIGSRIYGSMYDQNHRMIEIFDNIATSDMLMFESEKEL